MKTLVLTFILFTSLIIAQTPAQKTLLIRSDDFGMCHSVNLAIEELLESGIPVSVSIMFPCAWYNEAIEILKKHPEAAVGVHLTLNSEWKNYRWAPIMGKQLVPSLVDSTGFFFPSRSKLNANKPNLGEMELELRAQIERALSSGIRIDYMDYHMGAAVDKPEYRAIVEKLAAEYKLGISRYFGEEDVESMYAVDINDKATYLVNLVSNGLRADTVNLLVTHVGIDNDELGSMEDLNVGGLKQMSKHREAELRALLSREFNNIYKQGNVKFITYRDLIQSVGLENMKSPVGSGY